MEIPEHYRGREQAFIKHTLLKAYIGRLFMIIGRYASVIRYVDGFAGPWQEGTHNLEDTSIAISLDIMSTCRDGLNQQRKQVDFKALFVEKEKEPFQRLQEFLKGKAHNRIEAQCMNGDFFDLRDKILKWCGTNDFAFFFIDPTGWRHAIEIPTLRPLLQRNNSEYLINFMFDFILRTHTQTAFEEHMQEIFGEVPNTVGMTPKEREAHLLKRYRESLKNAQPQTGEKPRSAYVRVLDPHKDRTKYDLVYLTRHPRGIEVFMEESEKLEIIQRRVRARTKQERRVEKTGQWELFNVDSSIEEDEDRIDVEHVKRYWLKKLSSSLKLFGILELADMLEETDWFISDFQMAFAELEEEGKVKNSDKKRKRRTRFVNFDARNGKGEYIKRIE